MNETPREINEELLEYQTIRLQGLILEMLECCDDRRLDESKKFGLPYAELKCLMLFKGERYLTVKGIAQKLDVAKSRVTKLIQGLMSKGLIYQIDDPRDARIRLISPSPEGRKISVQVAMFQRDIHRAILLQMDDAERKNTLSCLESLRGAMEAVKKKMA
ncbi:MAG: MarR family winged helix-turn-helix transcriptional regulator [Pseudomonadota bacterium]